MPSECKTDNTYLLTIRMPRQAVQVCVMEQTSCPALGQHSQQWKGGTDLVQYTHKETCLMACCTASNGRQLVLLAGLHSVCVDDHTMVLFV